MGSTIVIAAVTFLVGLGLGVLLHKLLHSETAKNRRLERQIDHLQDQHTRYQAEVAEHFSRTAEMLGKLNANYRDIFNHLAVGAERLCSDSEFKSLVSSATPSLSVKRKEGKNKAEEDTVFEPPRDYAPKADPKEKGTLSEDYGFESRSHNSPEAASEGEKY
ncbi:MULTISPECIES: YhcB family protein [unclassified Hahella]|uniref:YhcB family protein n=1 Tax=unclassified Hahella TaxID=2624107 RepID=UPI001C1EE797|nr:MULTISPECIES: YhcB family protein [unclassified Hahella]MBU6949977.1 YhcB family protein [Hahella sp. HN01]MDG9668230.1 YhcB family protein [Hahella sp. CR1]